MMYWWTGKKDKSLFGWIDELPRRGPLLELSLASKAKLARENNERIISEWRSYLVKE